MFSITLLLIDKNDNLEEDTKYFCKRGRSMVNNNIVIFCLNLEMVLSSMSQYDNVTISNSSSNNNSKNK